MSDEFTEPNHIERLHPPPPLPQAATTSTFTEVWQIRGYLEGVRADCEIDLETFKGPGPGHTSVRDNTRVRIELLDRILAVVPR